MHASEAEVIANLLLRQMQVVCRACDQSAPPQPVVEVNQHRGDPLWRFEARDPRGQLLGTPPGLNQEGSKAQGNLPVFHQLVQ